MLAALAYLLLAISLLFATPMLLRLGPWQLRSPRLALGAWIAACVAGTGLTLAALVHTIAAAVTASQYAHDLANVSSGLFAWLGLGALGALIALVTSFAQPLATSIRDQRDHFSPVATNRERRRGFTLVHYASPIPDACSVAGRRPEIFLSSALEQLLSPEQLQAVVAHEYAHLRSRHALLVRASELHALCLPRRLTVGTAMRRATALLIELAADDTAARQAGAAHLANALERMGEATGDPSLILRAKRLAERRWPIAARRRVPAPARLH